MLRLERRVPGFRLHARIRHFSLPFQRSRDEENVARKEARAAEDAGMHAGKTEPNTPMSVTEIRGNFRDSACTQQAVPEDLKKYENIVIVLNQNYKLVQNIH